MNTDDQHIIEVGPENIAQEHICCSFSDKKTAKSYQAKKDHIAKRHKEGFRFKKLNIRGKVFIEYVPAENAWAPVEAPGYYFIRCFWVSGRYKGNGWAKKLLEEAEQDAKNAGAKGLVAISSPKKKPFMHDKKFFEKHGFSVCDAKAPFFELLAKTWKDAESQKPRFIENERLATLEGAKGFDVFFSDQCPYPEYWSKLHEKIIIEKGGQIRRHKIEDKESAQACPSPFTIYSLFHNGEFVTQEIFTEKKLLKLLEKLGY